MLGDESESDLTFTFLLSGLSAPYQNWHPIRQSESRFSQSVSSRSPALTTQTSQRTTAPLREYSRSPRSNTMYCDPTRNSRSLGLLNFASTHKALIFPN